MKLTLIIIFLLTALGIAYAGTTATPVQIGTSSTTGCPSGQSSCWIPVSTAAPLPITLSIHP